MKTSSVKIPDEDCFSGYSLRRLLVSEFVAGNASLGTPGEDSFSLCGLCWYSQCRLLFSVFSMESIPLSVYLVRLLLSVFHMKTASLGTRGKKQQQQNSISSNSMSYKVGNMVLIS